mmetsp:Transcript_74139/g.117947  ORF Transcript_74139/g.117947 Transcript_74139/m.117947 type:complete len:179 (+) Transcript_74139:42-578(+)
MARTKMEALKASEGKGKAKKMKKERKSKGVPQGFTMVQVEGDTSDPNRKSSQEVRFYQSNTELLIPKVSFQRLVRDICVHISGAIRMEAQALLCLQEASEAFLCGLFEDASLFAQHGRRVTVMKRDLQLSRKIRGNDEAGSKKWEGAKDDQEEPEPLQEAKSSPSCPSGPSGPSGINA